MRKEKWTLVLQTEVLSLWVASETPGEEEVTSRGEEVIDSSMVHVGG